MIKWKEKVNILIIIDFHDSYPFDCFYLSGLSINTLENTTIQLLCNYSSNKLSKLSLFFLWIIYNSHSYNSLVSFDE